MGGKAGRLANGTIDIDRFSASAADYVMVIITDSILIKSRGASRLDSSNEPFLSQNTQDIIHRLS
jgi:hypothetical protein